MRMLFEVLDLSVASPATVSRCGMVYIDSDVVGYKAIVESYFKKSLSGLIKKEDELENLKNNLLLFLKRALEFIKK